MVASYLHYVMGYNVAVVDCDYPQHSIVEMRERDLKWLWMIHTTNEWLMNRCRDWRKSIPGNWKHTGGCGDESRGTGRHWLWLHILWLARYNQQWRRGTHTGTDGLYFSPISADRVVMESTLRFVVVLNDTLITTGKSKSRVCTCYGIWWTDGKSRNCMMCTKKSFMNWDCRC